MAKNATLDEARIRALLTIRGLAAKAGVHEDTVRRGLNGTPISSLSEEAISQALGYENRHDLFPESVTA